MKIRPNDDGRSSGNGGPAYQPTFAHSALFSQNLILLSQNKAIYSAKTKLFSQRKPLYAYDMTFLGQLGSIETTWNCLTSPSTLTNNT